MQEYRIMNFVCLFAAQTILKLVRPHNLLCIFIDIIYIFHFHIILAPWILKQQSSTGLPRYELLTNHYRNFILPVMEGLP